MEITTELAAEVTTYLDELRDSGRCNMFGAGSYLVGEFGLSRFDARSLVEEWMKSGTVNSREG